MCDRGACPYVFINWGHKYGYILFIDKKLYAQGPLNNMFFIPPLVTLLELISNGEYFHPRSKVINLEKRVPGLPELTHEARKEASVYQIKANTRRSTKNTRSNVSIDLF